MVMRHGSLTRISPHFRSRTLFSFFPLFFRFRFFFSFFFGGAPLPSANWYRLRPFRNITPWHFSRFPRGPFFAGFPALRHLISFAIIPRHFDLAVSPFFFFFMGFPAFRHLVSFAIIPQQHSMAFIAVLHPLLLKSSFICDFNDVRTYISFLIIFVSFLL